MMYLKSLSHIDGATFRADGTENFDIKVVMTYDEWVKQGRPTWVDLTIGRD